MQTVTERFWSKVKKTDTCWEWVAGRAYGYGVFSIKGKGMRAHRYSYEEFHGKKIPEGLVIDHMCRNRACVNPKHLRAVTNRINLIENSMSFVAINAQKTHCNNGHELKDGNIYRFGNHRKCKICHAANWLKNYYIKKEKKLLLL